MSEAEPQKKEVRAIVTDMVIIGVALLLSIIILIQYGKTARVTIDTREDRYYRPVNPNIDLIYGNPEADLFIVEYGDLECPYCKEFHTHAKTLIQSDWGTSGRVAWVWRNGFHINDTSIKKAQTLECIRLHAGEQSRRIAWEFIEESLIGGVLEVDYPHKRYKALMQRMNIPYERVEECKISDEIALPILQAIEDVRELDIDETPYVQFISKNGELLFESVGSLTTPQLEGYVASILKSNKK